MVTINWSINHGPDGKDLQLLALVYVPELIETQ